ncbi:MAG: hypothetical protein HIU82_10460 [Proteobacteria bacterium]|nr:hypothetical protein [Pseudomonadota bacterium]
MTRLIVIRPIVTSPIVMRQIVMRQVVMRLILLFGLVLGAVAARAAPPAPSHDIVVQVDNPSHVGLALNNVENIYRYYVEKGEPVRIEVVAFGPGLVMLRADTSPVKARVHHIAEEGLGRIVFSACNNTLHGMERAEGHKIAIVPDARIVPSGAVRITELEHSGWSYLTP